MVLTFALDDMKMDEAEREHLRAHNRYDLPQVVTIEFCVVSDNLSHARRGGRRPLLGQAAGAVDVRSTGSGT